MAQGPHGQDLLQAHVDTKTGQMPDVWGGLEPLVRRTVGLGACMTGTGYLLADNAVDDFSQALLRQAGKDALQTQCPLP